MIANTTAAKYYAEPRGSLRWLSAILFRNTCHLALIVGLLTSSAHAEQGVVSQHALAQRTLLFSRLSVEDGLSQATVNILTQDRQGYIWVGTQEGLNRYDGQGFTVYEHDYDDTDSLSSDWIWSLTVDTEGVLWVGTEGGGLNRYDRNRDNFQRYQHDPDNPNSLSNDRVRAVHQDSRGIFWVGTDGGGLNRFDAQTGKFQRLQHDPAQEDSLPHDTVLAILEDRAGNLWVGTNGGGLSRLDRSSGKFTHFQHDLAVPNSLSNNKVRALYEDRDGRLWVATYEGGLNLFDAATGTFQHFTHDPENPNSLSDNRVRSIYQDHDGTLWVATDAGLNEWRPNEQGFARYVHSSSDIATISDNRITSLYQDRGGVLWVGTYFGVNKWNYLSDAFTYFQKQGTALKLSSNVITALEESKNGEIWVGTYGGGLNCINLANSSVTHYKRRDPDNAGHLSEHALADDRIMALNVDEQQRVWVGTRASGLSMLDPETGKFRHYQHLVQDSGSLSSNNVTSVLSEANGHVWVGTYGGGLNRLDLATGTFTHFRHSGDDSSSISSDRVLAAYRDRAGVLWIGTEDGGLNRFNPGTQSFIRYGSDKSDPDSLSKNSAWSIHESRDGSLWVGTNGGGLNRWYPADRAAGRAVFRKYRKRDGLRSDTVHSILEDTSGFLWLSSNQGLSQLDPDTGSLRHYGRNSGLRSNDFNFAAKLRSRSNRLLFGGTTGLVSFDPSQISSNRHHPDIVLSAMGRLGPLTTRYSTLGDDTPLELDHRDKLITFEFAGLDYSAPERNHYRYKLEGFDQDWSAPVQFRRATYTNLPAGQYKFTVQAANNDGFWNEHGVSIPLLVIPPPWLSGWAYTFYALLLLGAIVSYVRAQSKKLERETTQRQELEQKVELRTHELAQRNDELLSLNEQLKESSWKDSLTGLKNRRFLDEFIDNEVAQARRQTRDLKLPLNGAESLDITPALSFMMIDLDGFKAINDNYGHHAGDEALLQVRDILCECARKSDTIIRWGGDEFLIISRSTSNRAAEKLAERIRVDLSEHQYQLSGGHVGQLSGSIGFAVYPFTALKPDLVSWEQVSAIADQCAYIAKANGRNAWVGVYGNRSTTADDVAQIKTNIEAVLARGGIGIRTSIYGDLNLSDQQRQEAR